MSDATQLPSADSAPNAREAPGLGNPLRSFAPALINRRVFLSGVAGALAPMGCATLSRRGRPLSVLIILADDLGWGDLSCYGQRDYRTPEIDALAADGVRLLEAYAASCVCSPTRAALLTGRYPQRLGAGFTSPIVFRASPRPEDAPPVGLPPGHPTLASLLRARGYRTALVGKWHLGYPPRFGPLRSGFDEFFGITSGAVDYFTHRDGAGLPDLYENDVTVERAGYLTDLLSERAIDVIERAGRTGEPFYLSLHYTAVHWPWMGPGDRMRAGLSRLRDHAGVTPSVYAEMVRSLDTGVGRVLARLQTLGLARDTLVILTSDNGGDRFARHGRLRGAKETLLEGGIRVPAIVR